MECKNIFAQAIKKQDDQLKTQAEQRKEWGLLQVSRLTDVIEADGGNVSDYMWNMFLFNINGLRINSDGKVCYLSFYKPSKRILSMLSKHNNAIVERFNYITKGIF